MLYCFMRLERMEFQDSNKLRTAIKQGNHKIIWLRQNYDNKKIIITEFI